MVPLMFTKEFCRFEDMPTVTFDFMFVGDAGVTA